MTAPDQPLYDETIPAEPVRLLRADQFTIEELTAAYNQTRVDYMVPMPMNPARLAAYAQVYDVSLHDSLVAMDGDEILGLAMVGLRADRAWMTRLGVLPNRRRHGCGEALVRGLLAAAEQHGIHRAILEVIKGNQPAHSLFTKLGFVETRELLVLRRPPAGPHNPPCGQATWLPAADAVDALRRANLGCGADGALGLAWTNEVESYVHAKDSLGLSVDCGGQGRAWMIFRHQRFLLSHFIFHSEGGDPEYLAGALLSHLYARYPLVDTYIENLALHDPHLPALMESGCIEVFRRIEMIRV